MDLMKTQVDIRRNAEDMRDVTSDLMKWESDIARKDAALKTQKPVQKELPPIRGTEPVVASTPSEAATVIAQPQESIDLKDAGNKFFAAGQHEQAIQKYTESIEIYALNAVVFANRAMSYLKLNKFKQAEEDCDACLSLDPKYAKGYARRAMARRGLKRYSEAIQDFEKCLQLEPDHKPTKADLEATRLELAKSQQPTRKKMVITEEEETPAPTPVPAPKTTPVPVTSSSPASIPVQTQSKTASVPVVVPAKTEEKSPLSPSLTTPPVDAPTSGTTPTKTASSTPASGVSSPTPSLTKAQAALHAQQILASKRPNVPTTAPKTSYEFERVWNELKKHPDLFIQYLRVCKPETFGTLFKDSLSSDIFTYILEILQAHVVKDDAAFALSVLEGIALTNRFDMTIMFLSKAEKAGLTAIFASVQSGVSEKDRITAVAAKYGVK